MLVSTRLYNVQVRVGEGYADFDFDLNLDTEKLDDYVSSLELPDIYVSQLTADIHRYALALALAKAMKL